MKVVAISLDGERVWGDTDNSADSILPCPDDGVVYISDVACIAGTVEQRGFSDLLAAAAQSSGVLAYCLAHGYIDSMATVEAEKALAGLDAAIAKATGD